MSEPQFLAEMLIAVRAMQAREPLAWLEYLKGFGPLIGPVLTFVGLYWITSIQWRRERDDRRGREEREREERLGREKRERTEREVREFRVALARWAAAVHGYLEAQIAQAILSIKRENWGDALIGVFHTRQVDDEKAAVKNANSKAFVLRAAGLELRTLTTGKLLRDKLGEIESRTLVSSATPPQTWLDKLIGRQEELEGKITAIIEALPE